MAAIPTGQRESAPSRWARRLAVVFTVLVLGVSLGYLARRTLLLDAARIFLDRDPDVLAQEKADRVRIVFAKPPMPWVNPMKNAMNSIWRSIGAEGVNYYTFAGPRNLLRTYSERSNPASPLYQAWVGSYVTKRHDGTVPQDLLAWAKMVTELDQRSWLAAMGDPAPLAESTPPSSVGKIVIDGHDRELWQGAMRSHSDFSEMPATQLASLIGMPDSAPGIKPFHEVMLDGYFACWSDADRGVSIVVYAVGVMQTNRSSQDGGARRNVKDELLALMRTATVEFVH